MTILLEFLVDSRRCHIVVTNSNIQVFQNLLRILHFPEFVVISFVRKWEESKHSKLRTFSLKIKDKYLLQGGVKYKIVILDYQELTSIYICYKTSCDIAYLPWCCYIKQWWCIYFLGFYTWNHKTTQHVINKI